MFQHYAAIRYLIAPFVNAGHVLVRYGSWVWSHKIVGDSGHDLFNVKNPGSND